jgi:hypothetical protein
VGRDAILLGVFAVVIPGGMGLASIFVAVDEWGLSGELRRSGVVVQGTVVEYRAWKESPGGRVTFELTTLGGTTVRARDPNHFGGRLQPGDAVSAAYLPTAPERARLTDTGRGFVLVTGFWGLVFTGLGSFGAFAMRELFAEQ